MPTPVQQGWRGVGVWSERRDEKVWMLACLCTVRGREWLALGVVWRGNGWRAVSGLPSAAILIGKIEENDPKNQKLNEHGVGTLPK